MVEAILESNIAPYVADPTLANEVIQNILSGTHVSPNQVLLVDATVTG